MVKPFKIGDHVRWNSESGPPLDIYSMRQLSFHGRCATAYYPETKYQSEALMTE